jgi:hypothetical protein
MLSKMIGIEDEPRTMTNVTMYRGYRIEPNPYLIHGHEWMFTHEQYDGPGDPRLGTEKSVEACIARIDELEDE